MSNILCFENVELAYGRHTVLQDVNLQVRRGEFMGLVGPNGSGKSTLIKAMLGLIQPVTGKIVWHGGVPKRGYMPQREQVDPIWPMRVKDLLSMTLASLKMGHVFQRRERGRVDQIMDLIEIGHLAENTLDTLSGGEMQRVLLARALIIEPEVVLLDEPTSAMDLVSAEKFMSLLNRMHEFQETTVIVVTHDLPSLMNRAHWLGIIQNGTLYSGETEEMLTSDNLSRIYHEPLTVKKSNGRYMIFPGEDRKEEVSA